MINLNELEKAVTSGKVATLVCMIDGKELFALSFTLSTVAFKEILGVASRVEAVTIADKGPEKPAVSKPAEPVASVQKSKPGKSSKSSKAVTKPAVVEDADDDDDLNDSNETVEFKADVKTEPVKTEVKPEVKSAENFVEGNKPEVKSEPAKKLTRAEILAQAEAEENSPKEEIVQKAEAAAQEGAEMHQKLEGAITVQPAKSYSEMTAILRKKEDTEDKTFDEEW